MPNPWLDRLRALHKPRPTGACRIGSSYLPMRDLRRSGYYERVDREFHVGPLVALDVEGDDAPPSIPRTTLVVVRPPGQQDFTDHAVQVLRALHAPLRAAVRSYRAFERLRQLERAAETAYQALPQPVLVLRADGGIEYANPAADALLLRGELLATADGRLVRAGAFGPDALRLLLSGALRGGAQQVGICDHRGHGPVAGVLHLARLPPDMAFEASWPRGRLLATVQLPAPASDAKLRALARHFGLTVAEARVLRELSCGASATQIAERRQVRVSTVRTQIRGLLEKTGARRQADAMRLLLG
jgi:DNA-binding CsgD family transcriptional regulator